MTSKATHTLLVALPAWGHNRPLCALGAKIVNERPDAHVTMFTTPDLVDKLLKEVSRHGEGATEGALKRIRVVSIFSPDLLDSSAFIKTIPLFIEAYPGAYGTLLKEEPITCSSKNTEFEAIPAPSLIVMDFFAYPQLRITRALSPKVPVLAWVSGAGSSVIRLFGPEHLGGLGDFGAKIDAEAARTGKTPDEIGDKFLKGTNGTVVKVPGLPPMYDWEFFPQDLPIPVPMSPIIRGGYAFQNECDGAIIVTCEAYEKEALDAYRQWFADINKPVYAIGPLLPAGYGKAEITADKDSQIDAFLQKQLEQRGARSVVFISFGTFFWPTRPDYIEEMVEALIEADMPFIFCHASPFAKLPDGLSARVESSGIGILSPWGPQQTILNHPATGWFLTHGGHGGVTESLSSGVPLILWPFDADQPGAALHVAENLNAGVELIEVRTGQGLKPLKRNGRVPKGTREAVREEFRSVIGDLKGARGSELRANAQQLKIQYAEGWTEGGQAKSELVRLLNQYL